MLFQKDVNNKRSFLSVLIHFCSCYAKAPITSSFCYRVIEASCRKDFRGFGSYSFRHAQLGSRLPIPGIYLRLDLLGLSHIR